MPSTVKHYVHRVGRTARAGRSGRSVSLVGESERRMLKEVVKSAKSSVKARVIPPGGRGLRAVWVRGFTHLDRCDLHVRVCVQMWCSSSEI